jgi:hypothetical protein
METKVSPRAIIQSEIEVVRSLESKVEIYYKLMVGLLKNVGLHNSIF